MGNKEKRPSSDLTNSLVRDRPTDSRFFEKGFWRSQNDLVTSLTPRIITRLPENFLGQTKVSIYRNNEIVTSLILNNEFDVYCTSLLYARAP